MENGKQYIYIYIYNKTNKKDKNNLNVLKHNKVTAVSNYCAAVFPPL
jgi:hypothetical protein